MIGTESCRYFNLVHVEISPSLLWIRTINHSRRKIMEVAKHKHQKKNMIKPKYPLGIGFCFGAQPWSHCWDLTSVIDFEKWLPCQYYTWFEFDISINGTFLNSRSNPSQWPARKWINKRIKKKLWLFHLLAERWRTSDLACTLTEDWVLNLHPHDSYD